MITFVELHSPYRSFQVLGSSADGELTAGTHQVNGQPVSIDLNGEAGAQAVATLTEATINQDGQIILTGEDGTQSGTKLLRNCSCINNDSTVYLKKQRA